MSNSCDSTESGQTWGKQSGYIWALLGSAVGFANILTFSAQCYRNGGGAFLLPFLIAMGVLGLPMLYLEAMIGDRWKLPLVASYGKVCGKAAKILGWLAVIACATIGGFYIVLTGYSVAYMGIAGAGAVPDDAATFFQQSVLRLSSGVEEFGSFAWPLFITTAVVALFTNFVMQRGIQQGIEKTCSIFLPLLTVMVGGFAVATAFLPGAVEGWRNFLTPDFSRLLDVALWRDVFGHLFFSFSLGLGIVVGYSRHTGKQVNVVEAMRWVAFGDFAISFIAGLAVFGCMGYMAYATGVPFEQIVRSDSTFEIGFVAFPTLLNLLTPALSQLFGFVFFFCIFIAGITGVFSIVEAIAGNLEVDLGLSRPSAISATICVLMTLATFFCMGNGPHLIDTLVPMVMGVNMLVGGIAQIACFAWMSREIREASLWRNDWQTRSSYWLLAVVAPAILVAILMGNVVQDVASPSLAVAIRWIWFAGALSVATVVSFRRRREEALPAMEELGVETA